MHLVFGIFVGRYCHWAGMIHDLCRAHGMQARAVVRVHPISIFVFTECSVPSAASGADKSLFSSILHLAPSAWERRPGLHLTAAALVWDSSLGFVLTGLLFPLEPHPSKRLP